MRECLNNLEVGVIYTLDALNKEEMSQLFEYLKEIDKSYTDYIRPYFTNLEVKYIKKSIEVKTRVYSYVTNVPPWEPNVKCFKEFMYEHSILKIKHKNLEVCILN